MPKDYNVQLSAYIPSTLKRRTESQAQEERVSVSQIVRDALEEHLPTRTKKARKQL